MGRVRDDRNVEVVHAAKGILRRFWQPIAWSVVIFTTSCTRIGSRSFVHFVATASPARVTDQQFASFWQRYWWLFVKGYHMMEYFVLATLLLWRAPRKPMACAGIAVAFAISDEWHQTFVPYRGGRLSDVLIDCGGIALALLWSSAKREQALLTPNGARDTS